MDHMLTHGTDTETVMIGSALPHPMKHLTSLPTIASGGHDVRDPRCMVVTVRCERVAGFSVESPAFESRQRKDSGAHGISRAIMACPDHASVVDFDEARFKECITPQRAHEHCYTLESPALVFGALTSSLDVSRDE
jgi:hypothetical protein